MTAKYKIFERERLQKRVSQRVKAVGRIKIITHKRNLTYGANIPLPKVLFKPIIVEGDRFSHLWIKTDQVSFPFGTIIQFTGIVRGYRKMNGHISFTLRKIKNIKKVNHLKFKPK